jgi:hypothetical protein
MADMNKAGKGETKRESEQRETAALAEGDGSSAGGTRGRAEEEQRLCKHNCSAMAVSREREEKMELAASVDS